jgi:hypothetical protein
MLGACASAKVEDASYAKLVSLNPPPSKIWVRAFELPEDWMDDPDEAETAQSAVKIVSETVIRTLADAGYPAEATPESAGDASSAPAGGALLVEGEFLEIEEGNAFARVVIGFGAGATEQRSKAELTLWRDGRAVPIYGFEVTSKGSKTPGIITPIGLGSKVGLAVGGAAKAGGEIRGPVEADAERSGEAIAERLLEVLRTLGWPAPT